jgi:diguanylate cyclase
VTVIRGGLDGRDSYTGLGNWRKLGPAFRRVLREHRAGALIELDLDRFNVVNHLSGGHNVGDQVLAAIGRTLQELPRGNRAYRIGGDEFVILRSSADLATATALAEEVRLAIADAGTGEFRSLTEPTQSDYRVTATAGIVTWNRNSVLDAADIFGLADALVAIGKKRLYQGEVVLGAAR